MFIVSQHCAANFGISSVKLFGVKQSREDRSKRWGKSPRIANIFHFRTLTVLLYVGSCTTLFQGDGSFCFQSEKWTPLKVSIAAFFILLAS